MPAHGVPFTAVGALTGPYAPSTSSVQPDITVAGLTATNPTTTASAIVVREASATGKPVAAGVVPAGSQPANLNVSGVSTANPGVVTTSAAHGLTTGQTVTIASVGGATQANGTWVVTVLSATTFSIPVNVTGTYTSGGTVTPPFVVGVLDLAVHPERVSSNGLYVEVDGGAATGVVWVR
jgi:hypothetical protein